MTPSNLDHPIRKREEKGRRKEGKSQCRRGAPKSTLQKIPALASVPVKLQSPAVVSIPPPQPLPVVATPAVVPHPVSTNLIKDPTAISPNLPMREGKKLRRKATKEKIEKDPPKTAIRNKKKTQSVSADAKTSSENDGRAGLKNDKRKKESQTSSEFSVENKSDGSKEPSDNDATTPKTVDKETTKSYFINLRNQSAKSKRRTEDSHLETMPESSQLNISIRNLKKKIKKTPKPAVPPTTDMADFFNENGDPVWVVPEKQPGADPDRDEDGVIIRNKELATAMAEDELELDERTWYDYVGTFMSCAMPIGNRLPEGYKFDPFAPIEKLEENSQFINQEAISYNTVKSLVELSDDSIKRYAAKRDGTDDRAARPSFPTQSTKTSIDATETVSLPVEKKKSSEFQLKTCVTSCVTFDEKRKITWNYDRHHAISSIRRLRKRLENSCSTEQTTTQGDSKEKT